MKLISVIAGLFMNTRKRTSLFSAAVSEGIKDLFAEMGHKMNR